MSFFQHNGLLYYITSARWYTSTDTKLPCPIVFPGAAAGAAQGMRVHSYVDVVQAAKPSQNP
jgi:hypothetical protein